MVDACTTHANDVCDVRCGSRLGTDIYTRHSRPSGKRNATLTSVTTRMISTWLGLLVLSFLSLHSVSSIPTTRGSYNRSNQELFEEEIVKAKINLQIDLGRSSSASAPTHSDCTVRGVPGHVRNRLRLDRFYTQYAHAYGIPVLASSRVKRGALVRACYVMRFLFADRKDIRDWFYRRNGRAGIMAQTEYTTSIPEHRFLPAWWNQRARGLGATIQVPISTGGEENLLCLRGDRYYNEDIFLHEFVHGIHNLGATGAIRDFDRRLRAAYYSARSRGLWRSTYALSTDREYLAEGAQSFFNVNAYSAQPNGVHNHVNTRDKLRRYDPTLFNLVKEIFPCQNTFLKRCDAKNGKQAPTFRMNCKDGGGTVVTDKPPTPKPDTPPVPTPPKPNTPPVPTPPKPNTPPKPDTPPVPTPPKPNTPPKPDTPPVPTPPKPNTPPKPDTPPVPTPPKPNTPPKPDTPPVPTPPKPNTPPKPDTPPVPTPPKPNTPPKPDTPPVPTPPKPNTPPKPDTPPVPTPPKPNTPPKPDTPPVPTPPKPNTPPKPDTPPVPTPPKPNTPPKPDTPPVPTPPKPNTPPKPDTPPVPTPPKPNTPPKPDTPPVPTPPKPNTPPKPDTPPVPTPPKPNTPPKPDTPPVPTPPKPNTPPKPDTPPVPTPPKPNTPPKPDTPPVPTPPKPNTPPKPDTPPVPTPPEPNTPPKPDTPPLPTPPLPTRPKPTIKRTFRCKYNQYRYRDFNSHCRSWAQKGECARNPNYMLVYCCRSCGYISVTLVPKRQNCHDQIRHCPSWAKRGECSRNPSYMNQYCKRSCNRRC